MDVPHPTPHLTILVVEDDPAIGEVVRDMLRDEGVRVVTATTHADALTALSAVQFALVLADTAGGSVVASDDPWGDLDAIRRAAGAAPTVIFSAHNPGTFAGYAARGFAGFIAKPCDLDDVLHAIRSLSGPTASCTVGNATCEHANGR